MRKRTAPVPRKMRAWSAVGDPARECRADIAYRAYVLKALRRFDLEGRFESTRQPRERMLPLLALAPHAASDHVRGILEQEQAYQAELAMALAEAPAAGQGRVIWSNTGASEKRPSDN
jgi:hypothetical protein